MAFQQQQCGFEDEQNDEGKRWILCWGPFSFCLADLLGDIGHVLSSHGTSLPSSKTGQGLPPSETSGKILAQKSKAVTAGLSGS